MHEGPTGKLKRVGRELYRREPGAAELAAFGLRPEDYGEADIVKAWPDTALSVRVFVAMDTQWRHAFGGETGLDYSALAEVWERLKVPEDRRDDVFDDLRVLERAALSEIHREKKG